MALVTIRVLDGPDRGRSFESIPAPITIGREEGNTIQLNDDRISRFHLKIQEDDDRLVLTDLQSTNGTKVNGESVLLWNLRFGDVVSLGRSFLLFGSREQIAGRLAQMRGVELTDGYLLGEDDADMEELPEVLSLDEELLGEETVEDVLTTLHTLMPPELPRKLTAGQAAQLTELFQYLHFRMRRLLNSVEAAPKSDRVTLNFRQWQDLLDIHDRLARYINGLGNPE